LKSKEIELQCQFFEVLGAIGDLSFGRLCKCISKSEQGCWKSRLSESFDSVQRKVTKKCKLNQEPTNYQTTYEMQTSDTFKLLYPTINQDCEGEEHSEAVSNVESPQDKIRVNN
jgi:hypothetical protein